MPWSNALALLVRATLARQQGDAESAAALLADAIDMFTQVDMHLYAAVARRRLGAIVGGQRGRALQREANEWMAAQEIRNPAAMAGLVAPGFQS